jgi:DNA helicase-2/ATP-dependent DNA helicase PcrA
LQHIALRSEQDALKSDTGVVTLMTLHNAKGLEFPIVFMIGCEDGIFPHSRSIDEGTLDEERRLCYVGITRAQQRLYVTYAGSRNIYGARTGGIPSRFIGELPSELCERHDSFAGRSASSWADHDERQPSLKSDFNVGDDVVHASFGEGVVTAVQPGGVLVVCFSKEGSERKLMAAYAPLQKAGDQ